MSEYIERGAVLDQLKKAFGSYAKHGNMMRLFFDVEESVLCPTTADVVEVKHGRWDEDTYCTECRWFAEDEDGHIVQSFHNYCPNCGTKMLNN